MVLCKRCNKAITDKYDLNYLLLFFFIITPYCNRCVEEEKYTPSNWFKYRYTRGRYTPVNSISFFLLNTIKTAILVYFAYTSFEGDSISSKFSAMIHSNIGYLYLLFALYIVWLWWIYFYINVKVARMKDRNEKEEAREKYLFGPY